MIRLRSERHKRGLRMSDLAHILDVSVSLVSQLERTGCVGRMTVRQQNQLSQLFGVPFDQLMELAPDGPPDV